MIDHAFLFTKVVYSYLPKSCISIYRNRVFLFANYDVLLFTDYILKNEGIYPQKQKGQNIVFVYPHLRFSS